MLIEMQRGDFIDRRFEIEAQAGAGGMGMVYRARDRTTGQLVAIKLLHNTGASHTARFMREIHALSSVAHAHVVQYVTHGVTDAGEPYLVMEWLEGESLDDRLAHEQLGVAEAIELARHVAEALGAAHARGIVHRDIKPSNLFLVHGDVARVKVLDFGIAQLADDALTLTLTNQVIGTAGYMAPEQARGEQARVDARSDVFSLGCVLFECLTGRPAFEGAHLIALLAKLLLDEPPRVRALVPDAPAAVDALVTRMLDKDPNVRPADGLAVARALAALDGCADAAGAEEPAATVSISRAERRLVSVVAAAVPGHVPPAVATTVVLRESASDLPLMMRRVAARLGAHVEELAGGGIVALLVGAQDPTAQTALAARFALQVARAAPDVPLALATGRSESAGGVPVGEVIDRIASLLEIGARAAPAERPAVLIDEVTRALLGARFDVVPAQAHFLLQGEAESEAVTRILLGKPSRFLGRERELRHLVELVEEGFAEAQPVALLVTAAAGMGKSRLAHEMMQVLEARHGDMLLAVGRGDSIGAGSAYVMLAGALRQILGIATSEPLEVQQRKLAAAVREYMDRDMDSDRAAQDAQLVTELLGEITGVRFPDDDSPRLRAARHNAQAMAAHIQTACIDFLRRLTAVRPVLLVLEDLQWGDAPSVQLVDAALRELADRPFAVLALARPEVDEVFPGLWSGRPLQVMRLGALPRRAAAMLVEAALGPQVSAGQVAVAVERAGGNAFYLEELVRALAERHGDALPETVLGMVEARLGGLDTEARRLLRAGSIFGQRFCLSGAMALLGEGAGTIGTWREHLADLHRREILTPVRPSELRYAEEDEYAFRHALIREAAYAMLTERDRVAGHRQAGAWLLSAGEQDALVLAEHFDQGGEDTLAASFYHRAALQALRGHDLAAVRAHVQRGLELMPDAQTRGGLHAIHAAACFWSADHAASYESARRALDLAAPGSQAHWLALSMAIFSAGYTGQHEAFARLVASLLDAEPGPDTGTNMNVELDRFMLDAFWGTFAALITSGLVAEAEVCLRRLERIVIPRREREPFAAACLETAYTYWHRYVERAPWVALGHGRTTLALYEQAGELGSRDLQQALIVACELVELGALAEAEEIVARWVRAGDSPSFAGMWTRYARAVVYARVDRLDEALAVATATEAQARARGDHVLAVRLRYVMIHCLLQRGDADEAEQMLLALGEPQALRIVDRPEFFAMQARIRLQQGRHREAVRLAGEALAADDTARIGVYAIRDACRLVRAEALHAMGEVAAAAQAIRAAHDDLLDRAARIEDPSYRLRFLRDVPLHARVVDLARGWLGHEPARASAAWSELESET
jgi:tetratricopeptide (TPR) repeat protein